MFFDENRIWPREELPAPPPPRSRRERVMSRMILAYALILLLMPVSFDGIVDVVRWMMD